MSSFAETVYAFCQPGKEIRFAGKGFTYAINRGQFDLIPVQGITLSGLYGWEQVISSAGVAFTYNRDRAYVGGTKHLLGTDRSLGTVPIGAGVVHVGVERHRQECIRPDGGAFLAATSSVNWWATGMRLYADTPTLDPPELIQTFSEAEIHDAAFSADGEYLALTTGSAVRLYKRDGNEYVFLDSRIQVSTGNGGIYSVAFHPTGGFICSVGAIGRETRFFHAYNENGFGTSYDFTGNFGSNPFSVVRRTNFSPDGTMVAIGADIWKADGMTVEGGPFNIYRPPDVDWGEWDAFNRSTPTFVDNNIFVGTGRDAPRWGWQAWIINPDMTFTSFPAPFAPNFFPDTRRVNGFNLNVFPGATYTLS
jgi:hypothetical protein